MNNKKILTIIIFTLLLFACSTQKKVDDNNQNTAHKMDKKALPIGMVELSMEINKIIERDESKFCLAKIIEVHAYGNSVRALSEGIEYEFEIDNNLVKEFEQSSIVGNIMRCKLTKIPKGMDLNSPDKFKIISFVN